MNAENAFFSAFGMSSERFENELDSALFVWSRTYIAKNSIN